MSGWFDRDSVSDDDASSLDSDEDDMDELEQELLHDMDYDDDDESAADNNDTHYYRGEATDFCEKMQLSQPIDDDCDNVTTIELPEELRYRSASLDERRRADSIKFCRTLLNDVRLTKHERDNMRCEPEYHLERRLMHQPYRCRIPLRPVFDDDAMQVEMIIQPQRQRICYNNMQQLLDALKGSEEKKFFTVGMNRNKNTLRFIVENYVHVTYFVNSLSGELCKFSLVDLANKLQPYFVEYSCKKFAKVNMRIHNALSFLLYTSSVLVETGSDNQLLSRLLLQFVVTILREQCGYPHINIKRRKCQNIVATGKLNYNICMNVLKHKFQAAREKENFTGLVIKHRDLVKFFQQLDGDDDGYELLKTVYYVEDGDDDGIITQINGVNDDACMRYKVVEEDLGGADSTVINDAEKKALRPGYIINEYGEEEEEEEAIKRIMRLTDEYDTGVLRGGSRLNGTYILFREGQLISTGCKTDEELETSMPMLMRLTYMCRETDPRNRELEANLVAQKRTKSS